MKKTYDDLEHYCQANQHLKERWIAEELGMDPARFSKLKVPGKYRLVPNEAEEAAIAELLGQSVDHVRSLYPRAA